MIISLWSNKEYKKFKNLKKRSKLKFTKITMQKERPAFIRSHIGFIRRNQLRAD